MGYSSSAKQSMESWKTKMAHPKNHKNIKCYVTQGIRKMKNICSIVVICLVGQCTPNEDTNQRTSGVAPLLKYLPSLLSKLKSLPDPNNANAYSPECRRRKEHPRLGC
uniref:Uncharacterized protein n=1 Tax=Cucumis melo TaxID=3656 RepID=A0A9I9DS23_CUCME